jgi:hypothetical protein
MNRGSGGVPPPPLRERPLSNKRGTFKTGKARLWSWLLGESPEFQSFPFRSNGNRCRNVTCG